MALPAPLIAATYRDACRAELTALKPGNVHRFAGGHGMDVGVFERSADVSAPEIAAPGRPVGARVRRSVDATFAAVGMNTNLGILLLCAPLAAAAEGLPRRPAPPSVEDQLHEAVADKLAALGPDDARDVFAAIARASPGGLGDGGAHDVRAAPTIGLVEAMRIAAPRDLVARQYAESFAAVFSIGVPALRMAHAENDDGMMPAVDCFLTFAAAFPDSHVARKFGDAAAVALQHRMADARKRLKVIGNRGSRLAFLAAFDAELKREGLNPGTSADLTVASIFADGLCRQLEDWGSG
ncbi:triphosphoribosyl-dephospho-CoA synthase [Aureimonas sp. SA4125]|uniref:triphosphoribosyl-dephospho-CoA synthase n=1 Tax=Aureimonas sp. SA4125 TaxID=2826993 RepID=UPI001CC51E54|nr:triphosphoribosyl-dephospho-CoA synthase [Aureimonas sp. SA4125]BDA86313.1 triphosphoribosyl-dephospho-CoA synthase [Aureimonas sp. SA4125]